IGGGKHGPDEEKVAAIKNLVMPTTKKPNAGLPFQIHYGLSDYGVGSNLTHQDSEGNCKPIAFASQKLTTTQRNWANVKKETWSVLFGLKKFEKWIY
ncbi:retrovirus-related Pol polyprotein from transposon opus, partial [Nephila pilipes]